MTAIIKKFFENDSVLVFNENDLPGVGDISQIQSDITDLQTNKADKIQNNLVATTDPIATNDSSEGYEPLSVWINNSTNEIFKCLSNSVGAAVWVKTTLTIDELGSMAIENTTDYYTKTEIDLMTGGGIGFYYDNINHRLQNKIALQTKLNDDFSNYLTTDGTYVYYSNNSDWSKIYRINIDGTLRIKLNDDSSEYITTDGTYVYYSNSDDGYKIYKINNDGTGRIKLNDDQSYNIITNLTYVFYRNESDSGKLYRINNDGTLRIKLNDDNSSYITTDGTYVYYSNGSDGNKLYRIDIDGSNRVKLNDDSCEHIVTDGTYVYYKNDNDGAKLYRIDIDGSNRVKLNDDYSWYITTDGTYIFYSNGSDGNKLYKINNDGTLRIKLNDDNSSYITTYGTYVYYSNGSNGYKLYKSEISNLIYFAENDNIYESEVIENNSQNIYIKSYQNIPLGTDYTFSLANAKVENIVITEGDTNIFLMGDSLYYMGGTYNLEELFNVGDIITLYKTGESDIQVEISNVNSSVLDFTTDTGYSGGSWGIKGLVQNYEIIPNTSLDGKTKIDLLDLFGVTTNELYYKIELDSDITKTKTPIVNIIELTK